MYFATKVYSMYYVRTVVNVVGCDCSHGNGSSSILKHIKCIKTGYKQWRVVIQVQYTYSHLKVKVQKSYTRVQSSYARVQRSGCRIKQQ